VLEAGGPLFGYVADGYWEDVGTTAAYLKATRTSSTARSRWTSPASSWRPACTWARDRRSIRRPGWTVRRSSGENCTIDEEAVIGAYTTIGANTRVSERAELSHSVIGENSYIGQAARVEGSVLGRACDLRHGARCEPGSVVGEGCSSGPTPSCAAASSLPLQGCRGGRAGAVLDRVGVGRDPHPLRSRGGPGHRQRGHQPGVGGAPGQGLGVRRWRRARSSPPPGTPAGPPGCSSGP